MWCIVATVICFWVVESENAFGEEELVLSLDECLEIALAHNHSIPASRYAVVAAEAQHQQALSGYWPQLSVTAGYKRTDEPPNFIFPAGTLHVPPQSIGVPASTFQTPATSITVPAGALGPGSPPISVPVDAQQVHVPGQTFNLPGQEFPIPEQDIRLMDEDSFLASISAQWLIWDGGMRKGLRQQAQAAVDVAHQDVRRTDLEVYDSVVRLYYGAVMARQIAQVGVDTLARMEATLSLTETMYKEGSGTVMKTDYLDNKVMVETLRATVALLEKNVTLAQAALAYTLGFGWKDSVIPINKEIPYAKSSVDLDALVSNAYSFSPDWKSLEAGIRAAEGVLIEAKSGHYPKLAITGELHRWWNDYDAGAASAENKEGWTVGVGIELPLFEGFLVKNKRKEALARLKKMEEEKILLREGIGLRVREVFIGLEASEKRHQATFDAMISAVENRDLNTRAYQNDLVETEDVIRAQLMEAFMTAQHYKMRYDHMALLSKLKLLVGAEVTRLIQGDK